MNFSQNQQEYFHFKIYSFFTNTYKWLIMRKLLKILQRNYTPCFLRYLANEVIKIFWLSRFTA